MDPLPQDSCASFSGVDTHTTTNDLVWSEVRLLILLEPFIGLLPHSTMNERLHMGWNNQFERDSASFGDCRAAMRYAQQTKKEIGRLTKIETRPCPCPRPIPARSPTRPSTHPPPFTRTLNGLAFRRSPRLALPAAQRRPIVPPAHSALVET